MALPILALLRSLFEAVPVGVAVLDSDLRYAQINQRLAEMNGRSVEDHVGRSLDEVLPEQVSRVAEPSRSVLETGIPVEGVEITAKVFNRIGTWLLSFHPIREDSAVVGVLIFIAEITEQRRAQQALQASERLFRTLTSRAPVGIFMTDARGHCQFVNERWQELAGMSLEDALGEGWVRALHPEDRAWVLREWERATAAGEEFCAEYRFQTPDGKVTWLQGRGMQLREGQEVKGYLGTVTDITARREADELRRQMLELNERLVGMVSHDLRTPLSTIRLTASNLLRHAELPAHAGKAATTILRNADRMDRMIHELLDLTHARLGGGIPIKRKATDLAELCEEVVSELKAAEPERDIACQAEGDVRGDFDRDRLHAVVTNLVSNAVQYGAPPIRLRVHGTPAEVILEVHDAGSGIPAEELGTLFEPFRRGAAQRQERREGLGLGLYICREVVRAHGGTIEVCSTPVAGTTFTVRLPRWPQQPADTQAT